MKRSLGLLFLILMSEGLLAQGRHPVDEFRYRALQDAVTTADMIAAQQLALDGWDQLLDITLLALRERVQPGTAASFDESQLAWNQYRDAEFQAIDRLYFAELQGTMWRPVAVSARARLVKQRVMSLLDRYTVLQAQEEASFAELEGTWRSLSEDHQLDMELREDLTLIWRGANDEDDEFAFYRLSSGCGSDALQGDRRALIVYLFGSPESTCYFIELLKDDQLRLSKTDGETFRVFERGQR